MEYSKERYFGLGSVPVGIGAVIEGWDIPQSEFRDPNRLPSVDFRTMTSACPHDCFHCFTDKQKKTLNLEEVIKIIDQLADMKAHSINFIGEGEPTIDPNFFDVIEYSSSKGIQPVIFTEGAARLRDKDFVRRLYKTGASVCFKCDSLWNPEYQNWVVRDRKGKYFEERDEAINILISEGFNKIEDDGTTRMGFDMVVTKRNMHEVEKTLRYCRENNLWIIFAYFLPSGRSGSEDFDNSLTPSQSDKEEISEMVRSVDNEYDFHHEVLNNFLTGVCVEFMQIYGDGSVSPCPGNETRVGNVKTSTIKELQHKILEKYPSHNRANRCGSCLYRPLVRPVMS